jgi:glycosyltransferase involved in cell wall biosynthesis
MNICIDVRSLLENQYSGVSYYTYNLLVNIFENDQKNNYKLFYNSFGKKLEFDFNYPNVKIYRFRFPNKLLNFCFLFFKHPKIDKMVEGCDVFFAPNLNFFALSKNIKKIITVHDLSFKIFPKFFSLKQRLWHSLINVCSIVSKFNSVIAVSFNTKKDLIKFCDITKKNINVVYLGVNPYFFYDTSSVRTKINNLISKDYILSIITLEPRKNIENIIFSFENTASLNKDILLVLIGKKGYKSKKYLNLIKKSKFSDRIIFFDYISGGEKWFLIDYAKVLMFISFYEGFGLPILEAQSRGVPVICSYNSSFLEVLGKSSLFVNPYDLNDISCKLENLLSDCDLYNDLKERSLLNAKRFNWKKTALKTVKIFENL